MAQSSNNTVKWGMSVKPKATTPSFRTANTTPAIGNIDVQGTINRLTTGAPSRPVDVQGTINRFTQSAPKNIAPSPVTPTQSAPASTGAPSFNTTPVLTGVGATSPAPTKSKGVEPFRGILNSLLGASKPTREQEKARREMEKIARGNEAIGDAARATSEKYGQEIARVGQLGAGAVAGNLSTGTNVVGSGNAAIASQSASQRMNALAQGLDAELKGSAQQLTGQEQMAQAFNPSLQATLAQQQQQITGLNAAGGLAQPLQVPYSSGLFNPATGEQSGGGFGGWAGYTTAQQAQSLIEQYPDAGVQYNPNLSPEQNLQMIQQALGGSPSYQRGTFGVAGANSYIGAQQLGAAGNLTGQVAQIQTLGGAADANFNLMLGIMERGGINDLNQPILNQLQQGITRGLTSNEDLVAFRSALQTVRSQYASILGGGTPTDATQAMAAEKIPDTVSLGALQEVERTIRTMINNTIASYNQQIGSYSSQGGYGGNSFAEQW